MGVYGLIRRSVVRATLAGTIIEMKIRTNSGVGTLNRVRYCLVFAGSVCDVERVEVKVGRAFVKCVG